MCSSCITKIVSGGYCVIYVVPVLVMYGSAGCIILLDISNFYGSCKNFCWLLRADIVGLWE